MERIKNNQTLSALDGARYQLPTPPEGASEEQWGKAVKNAEAQLEHQNGR
jgi:pre-mRNA-splicing factor SPF27